MSLNDLSLRLNDSGDSANAVRAIEEAVEIYRRLAQTKPATFEPHLAMNLHDLSGLLYIIGDSNGARHAIESAVEIYRRLAQAQPTTFEPDLALSLQLRKVIAG